MLCPTFHLRVVVLVTLTLGACKAPDPEDCHAGYVCPDEMVCNQKGRCVASCNSAADCEAIEDCELGICVVVPEDQRECVSDNDCVATIELSQCEVAKDPFCQAGKCAIEKLREGAPCSDDDLCTIDDACDADGVCAGENVVCNTRPHAECVGGNAVLRSYTTPGQCNAVTADCFYVPIDIACPNCSETCLGRCTGDLAVYYSFLEGEGVDRYQDNSGNNNYAECSGAACPTNRLPGAVDGPNNYAVEFDGVDDRIVAVDDPTLDPVDFTLTVWVELPADVTLPMAGRVVGKRNAADFDNYTYSVQIAGDPPAVSCEIANAGVANVTGSHVLEIDRWHHIGCIFSSSSSELRLFVDGAEAPGTMVSTTVLPPDTDGPLVVGSDGDEVVAPFTGLVDEVRLCPLALEDVAVCHLGGGFWATDPDNLTWDDPAAQCLSD